MTSETIVCKNLQKVYQSSAGSFEALKDVNIQVHQNELLMLVGPSGAGKTTLLSIMAGILSQTGGECEVLSRPINQLEEKERTVFRGKHIGFVFQSFNLIPSLTALENVSVPLLIHGMNKREALDRSMEILETLGLGDRASDFPPHFSGGQLQRISIARGCVHRPKIILCDEPTSFLDHENGSKVMELMKKIQKRDQSTFVIVTHDPRIFDFADRIVEINDGVIKTETRKE